MVTALKFEPGKNPYPCQLCDNGDYLDHCVSIPSLITYKAAVLKIANGIAAVYCWNGHLFSLPGNRCIEGRILCGCFYIVRVKNGKLVSLTDQDIVKYSLEYWEPESYTEEEIIDSWFS